MRTVVGFFAVALLMLGTIGLTGCSSSDWQHGSQATTAGGNGEFGENPAQPGSYRGEQDHQGGYTVPATQPGASY